MTLFQFISLATAMSLLVLVMKSFSKEYAVYTLIAVSIVLLLAIVDLTFGVVEEIQSVFAMTSIPTGLFTSCIKVIGLAYLTEFSASITTDAGEKSIGDKVRLFGKMSIFLMTLPLLKDFIKMITVLL